MKIKKNILCLMSIFLVSTFSLTANAEPNELKNIKDLPEIRPYQEIIDKVNLELGSEISIPDNMNIEEVLLDRDTIYNNIINQSLEEFEINIKNEYEEFIDGTYQSGVSDDEGIRVSIPISENLNSDSNYIQPLSIRETLTQKHLLYNANGERRGAVDLIAEVFSGTGKSGTFTYSRIDALGYYTYTDITHFRSSSASYTLSSDKKNCTGVYVGSYYTASGLMLAGRITYTITYNAG